MSFLKINFKNFKHQILLDVDYDLFYRSKSIDEVGLQKNKINVFDLSANYEWASHYDNLINLLKKYDWPYIVLSSNPECNHEKVYYYPQFLIVVRSKSNFDLDIESPRPYKFCSLNGRAHAHRIFLYFNLLHNLDSCWLTFHNQPGDTAELSEVDPALRELAARLPISSATTSHMDNRHSAYSNAYVDICAETMMRPGVFISEKTWKPIVSGQLFLIAGCPGTIDYLRSQGIDVFDDFIDHSYDQPGTWQERIALFAECVRKLAAQDLDKIWQQTLERRQANRELIKSQKIEKFYLEKIDAQTKFYYPDLYL